MRHIMGRLATSRWSLIRPFAAGLPQPAPVPLAALLQTDLFVSSALLDRIFSAERRGRYLGFLRTGPTGRNTLPN